MTIADLTNFNCGQFTNCEFVGVQPTAAKARLDNCVFTVEAGEILTLSGNGNNITIICNGGTVCAAPGTTINGLNLEGQRCTLKLGDNAQISGMNAKGAFFLTFQCGNNVTISNSDCTDAIFSCTQIEGSVAFKQCNFCGCHMNPCFAGASFTGCTIDANTRAQSANLPLCTITDLIYVHEDGTRNYVRNLSECGLPDHPCGLSPQATMASAGLTGGTTVTEPFAPTAPNISGSRSIV